MNPPRRLARIEELPIGDGTARGVDNDTVDMKILPTLQDDPLEPLYQTSEPAEAKGLYSLPRQLSKPT